MTATELKSGVSLAVIAFLRMFGLFLILPIFVLYADNLAGASPMLIGVAFGVYGLTQALLQIPFGIASDRIGRKTVICAGLSIFAVGSLIAAAADSIWLMILGRALQGAGAISAALMALAADLSRPEQRTKIMALIGASIGFAFALAFVMGPILDGFFGVPGVFVTAAVLSVVAIVVLYALTPTPARRHLRAASETSLTMLRGVLKELALLRLYRGVFVLHLVLMANFFVVPVALRDYIGMASEEHWQVYFPVLLLSVALVAPFIVFGERARPALIFKGAVLLLLASQIGYAFFHDTLVMLAVWLLVFFTAFNYLEASLPTRVSTVADDTRKGAALGVYASSQFIGTFTGGVIGGIIYGSSGGLAGVFVFCVMMVLVWFTIDVL